MNSAYFIGTKAALVDIGGVLHVGDQAIEGAAAALRRMRQAGLAIRFLTNTSRVPRDKLVRDLDQMGLAISPQEMFTAPQAAYLYCQSHGLRPFLLIHRALRPEFNGLRTDNPNAVVVGDAAEDFSYENLNRAFRVLMAGGSLVSMGNNRYFRETPANGPSGVGNPDGLSLDIGPFVAALQMASGTQPVVVGKPAATFFQAALDDLGVRADQTIMIGDDVQSDIGGAVAMGIPAILVRTGKFRPEDERVEFPGCRRHWVVDSIAAAFPGPA